MTTSSLIVEIILKLLVYKLEVCSFSACLQNKNSFGERDD